MRTKGQTTVEFALTALVLFVLVFAIIDLSVMFYVNLTMQHAVREGARYAVTRQDKSTDLKGAMIQKIKDSSCDLYDKNVNPDKDPTVSVVTPTDASTFNNYTGRPVSDTGNADEIIIVKLVYSWPLLTPILQPFFDQGNYTFTVRATMKNESWDNK